MKTSQEELELEGIEEVEEEEEGEMNTINRNKNKNKNKNEHDERIDEELKETMDVLVTRKPSRTLSMRRLHNDGSVHHPLSSYKEEEERDEEEEERDEEEEANMNTINNKNKSKCRGHHLYQDALNRKQRLEEKLLKERTNDNDDKQTRTPKASRKELERLAHQRYMKAEEHKKRLNTNKMKSEQEEINKTKSVIPQGRFFHFDFPSSKDTKRYERYSLDSNEEKKNKKSGFEAKSMITKKTNEGNVTSTSNSTSSSNGSRCGAAVSSLSRIQANERLANLSEQGRLKLLARNNVHNRRSNLAVVVEQRGFSASSKDKQPPRQKNSDGVSRKLAPPGMRLHSLWRHQDDIGKSRRMAIEQRLAEKNKISYTVRFMK